MDDTAQLTLELPLCTIPGCDGVTGVSGTARGLCSSHYHKWCRYGDALYEKPVPSWKATDLAWVAGFIDADGTIILESSRDERQATVSRCVPKIAATNVDRRPIDMLHSMFGGTCYMHKRSDEARERQATKFIQRWHQFVWAVSGTKAVQIARAIEPYLRRKSDQARVLIEFEDGGTWSKGGNAASKLRPELELQRRLALVRQMQDFNKNVVGGVRL